MRILAMSLWFLLSGCIGTGTSRDAAAAHRPVTAPVSSAARLGQEFFSPEAITRSIDRMLVSAHTITSLETQRMKGLPSRTAAAVSVETQRIGKVRLLEDKPGRELRRLGDGRDNMQRLLLDLRDRLVAFRKAIDQLPRVLGLDRQPLREPDDLRGVEVSPEHPREPSLLERILRRLLP
jgi:hypothetical protein